MAADTIVYERELLEAPGQANPPKIRNEVTVTNGLSHISIGIRAVRIGSDGKVDESAPVYVIVEGEQADLIADALIRKSVNLRRGVHDNSDGAI